jgi:hypothetical protein
MKIRLSIYNSCGALAAIESHREDEGNLDIVYGMSYSAETACKLAALKLRKMADRFDLLANEKTPFNIDTQNKINKI